MNFNKNMVEENFIMMMEVFIQEIGIKIKEKIKVSTIMEMKIYMKVYIYMFNL